MKFTNCVSFIELHMHVIVCNGLCSSINKKYSIEKNSTFFTELKKLFMIVTFFFTNSR